MGILPCKMSFLTGGLILLITKIKLRFKTNYSHKYLELKTISCAIWLKGSWTVPFLFISNNSSANLQFFLLII